VAKPGFTVSAPEHFSTERCCDKITIDGEQFAGTAGPQDVYPLGPITWKSDSSFQLYGWRLCASPSTPPPTPAPTTTLPPWEGSCGVKGPDDTPWIEIVNGQPATKCEWPWQAQLRQGQSGEGRPFCGATLLDERWVLTAAHCIHETSTFDFTVKLGDYDTSKADPATVNRRVKMIHKHSQYNDGTYENDIALLELAEPVRLTSCIAPACLPEADEAPLQAGATCWITGWGTFVEGGYAARTLQEGQVQVVSRDSCKSAYNDINANVSEDMICAQGTFSGTPVDACQGDSGGPLVCDAGAGRYVVHGATSWGQGCARSKYPGIYAEVAHQREWIRSISGL